MNKTEVYAKFLRTIIFWGRLTLLLALVLSFAPAFYLLIFHGIIPPVSAIIKAMIMISGVMITSWIVEPIAYFPILGTTGTYMSWLAGNISNMRVPVSAIAQDVAGVKEGSPEGDIISTLGIGMSVLINLLILMIGVILGIAFVNAIPENLRIAFNYILPAVFGAVLANFALRNLKLGIIALVLAFVLTTLKLPTWIVLPVCVFGIIGLGVFFFKLKSKTAKS